MHGLGRLTLGEVLYHSASVWELDPDIVAGLLASRLGVELGGCPIRVLRAKKLDDQSPNSTLVGAFLIRAGATALPGGRLDVSLLCHCWRQSPAICSPPAVRPGLDPGIHGAAARWIAGSREAQRLRAPAMTAVGMRTRNMGEER